MEPVIIIPARRDSTRLPEKMLIEIDGKPLIRWTAEAALATGWRVILATDHHEIAEASGLTDFRVTGPCNNGTERCIEAAHFSLGMMDRRMIINWQGDSPMTRPESVLQLARVMANSPCAVGTIEQHVDRQAMKGEVEVIHGHHEGLATSFGRATPGEHIHYRHMGIYAIKPEAISFYGRAPSPREIMTGLEQLRWIDRGVAIAAVTVPDYPSLEINTEADIGMFKTCLESEREAM